MFDLKRNHSRFDGNWDRQFPVSHEGEPERAARPFTDSLSLYEARHYRKGIAECLAGLARVEVLEDRLERAARLCGAAEAILARLGARLDTLDRADYARTLESLRDRLGEELETLLDEGRAMSTHKAVEYAVADCRTTRKRHESGLQPVPAGA